MRYPKQTIHTLFFLLLFVFLMMGCSKTYYSAMEKVGIHKRDILVGRVEGARDAQTEAQKQFKSALEQFGSMVALKDTNLKKAYTTLNAEYTDCERASEEVSDRIDKVEKVSDALFDEWEKELKIYTNKSLRDASKKQLYKTKSRYKEMLASMHVAENSMAPILITFRDNVLFLKHNLNAQAIGSLQSEFSSLEKDISVLIKKMDKAIKNSNQFIAQLESP